MAERSESEEKTDEIIQEMGWQPRANGGWEYVARDNREVISNTRRVKHIAQLLGVSLDVAKAYCDSLET